MAVASARGSPGGTTRPQPVTRTTAAVSDSSSAAAITGRPAARTPHIRLGTMYPASPRASPTTCTCAAEIGRALFSYACHGRKRTGGARRIPGRPARAAGAARAALARERGEHVLADNEERRAEPSCDELGSCGDERRVGHADDDVGPTGPESFPDGANEVREVVRGPTMQLRSVIRRRVHADDRD